MPASRGTSVFDKGFPLGVHRRANVDDGKLAWHFQHVPGVVRPRRSVRACARRQRSGEVVFTIGKSGHPLTRSSQRQVPRCEGDGVPERHRPHRPGRPASSPTATTSSSRRCSGGLKVVPGARGGHNWQAMSYHQPTNALIIPRTASCMEMSGRPTELRDGAGGVNADRPLLRDAGNRRQRQQARRVRCGIDEGTLEHQQRVPF